MRLADCGFGVNLATKQGLMVIGSYSARIRIVAKSQQLERWQKCI